MMTNGLLEEGEKELYKWLNDLSAATGLHAQTLSDLYLQGWIVQEETYEDQDENQRPVEIKRVSFWKDYK